MLSFLRDPDRHYISRLGIAVLVYLFIFQGLGYIIPMLGIPFLQDDGQVLIASSAISLYSIILILGSPDTDVKNRMTIPVFIWLILLINGMQMLSSVISAPLINSLKDAGYSLENATASATGASEDSMWIMVYSILVAPVIEELTFRGVIYGYVRRYGMVFAMLVSSICFALLHLNIIQLPLAFLVGMLLCAIRERYGLANSILLHITNNLFAIISNLYLSTNTSTAYISSSMFLLGSVVLIVTVILNLKRIIGIVKSERGTLRNLGKLITTPSFFLVTLLLIYATSLNVG